MFGFLKDGLQYLSQMSETDYNDRFIVYDDNGNPATTTARQINGTGWAFYDDGVYTDTNFLNVNNEKKQVLIDGLGLFTELDYLPYNRVPLWQNNKITPERSGDAYNIRLDFTAIPRGNADKFTLHLNIGDESDIIILSKTFETNKSIGSAEIFSFSSPIYCLSTFVSNGGKFEIETSDELDFYNFGILIQRLHKGP